MSEDVAGQITKVKALSKVLEILLQAREPLVAVKIIGSTDSGTMWIRAGTEVIAARTESGESGYVGFMKLLTLREATFARDNQAGNPQSEPIKVDIVQFLTNRPKVIEAIKLSLLRSSSSPRSKSRNLVKIEQMEASLPGPDTSATPKSEGADEPPPALKRYSSYRLSAKDDLAARRKDEINVAGSISSAAGVDYSMADTYAELLDPSDKDLALRREMDLNAGSAGEIVFPPIPADEKAPVLAPQQQQARRRDCVPGTLFGDDTESSDSIHRAYTPRTDPNGVSILTLAYLRQSDRDPSVRSRFNASWAKMLAEIRSRELDVREYVRRVGQLAKLATLLCVMVLPLVAVCGYQWSKLEKQLDTEDALSIAAEVNTMMDEPYLTLDQARRDFDIAAVKREIAAAANEAAPGNSIGSPLAEAFPLLPGYHPTQHALALPDRHSSFEQSTTVGTSSGPAAVSQAPSSQGGQSDANEITASQPAQKTQKPLTKSQIQEISEQMKTAEELVSAKRLQEALAIYSTMLAKYPQRTDLRLAAIRISMLCKDYQEAKTLCVAGMNNAARYPDFLTFNSLLRTLPGGSANSPSKTNPAAAEHLH